MRAGRFRGDDLPRLPDWGLRAEVLDGRLVLAPPAARRHERVVQNLAARLRLAVPPDAQVAAGRMVQLTDGDAAVPDLIVTTGGGQPAPLQATSVHTVVEVVDADGRHLDQVYKPQRYAEAGIRCCWRVQLVAWPGYRGGLPLVVTRVREAGQWSDLVAPAGRVQQLPVAYRRGRDGAPVTTMLRLDPRWLLMRAAATR